MSHHCAVGRHDAAPAIVRNQGFEFGRCRGCGRDLIRSRGRWTTVPSGFRVVWRRRAPTHQPSAAQLLLDLPASGGALALAGRRPRPRRLAAALDLLLIGLRCAAEAALAKVRAWRRAQRERRPGGGSIRCLPAG